MIDGKTFDPALDEKRLTKQLGRVWSILNRHGWITLQEISSICRKAGSWDSEAAVSARIRDLRKTKYGAYTIERRRVKPGSGLWEYRLVKE